MTTQNSRRLFFRKSIGTAALMAVPVQVLSGAVQPEGAAEKAKGVLRFAVASDGHFGQPKTDYVQFHQNIVSWLNRENDVHGLDFCLFNGDIIHDDPTMLPQAKEAFSGLKMPYFVTKGNHDMVSADAWKATWGYPPDHSFTKGDYGFVLGNTSNEKGEYLCADVSWLKETLHKYRKKKGVFVFLHITQRKWTGAGIDCPEVMNTLASFPNVSAIFHGHDHDQHEVKTADGKPYLFDGHFGGSWGLPYKGYRIVEVLDNGKIRTYQYNPELNPVLNHQLL